MEQIAAVGDSKQVAPTTPEQLFDEANVCRPSHRVATVLARAGPRRVKVVIVRQKRLLETGSLESPPSGEKWRLYFLLI